MRARPTWCARKPCCPTAPPIILGCYYSTLSFVDNMHASVARVDSHGVAKDGPQAHSISALIPRLLQCTSAPLQCCCAAAARYISLDCWWVPSRYYRGVAATSGTPPSAHTSYTALMTIHVGCMNTGRVAGVEFYYPMMHDVVPITPDFVNVAEGIMLVLWIEEAATANIQISTFGDQPAERTSRR